MDAFQFVVTIPTAEYEKYLLGTIHRSIQKHEKLLNLNVSVQNECEPIKHTASSDKLFTNRGSVKQKVSKVEFSDKVGRKEKGILSSLPILDEIVDESGKSEKCGIKKSLTKTSLQSCTLEEDMDPQRTPTSKKSVKEEEMEIIEDDLEPPLEKAVEETLIRLNITAISWISSTEGNHYHISFGVQGGAYCEKVLHELKGCGVGSKADSTLSVLPCALHYSGPIERIRRIGKSQEIKDSAWDTFVRSVRSRLTVAQLLEQVKAGAELTFDFFFLLIVAALTAAIGLAENSTVIIVASMLISPLMGPIMAGTFGTAIQDRNLQKIGILHELIGVFCTMAVGFVFGLIICGIDENYGPGQWPTSEILSRCDVRSLWVGALVALPSGAAVAISALSGNVTSLVGVAISASLLPPAVNAGLLWALSLLVFLDDNTRFKDIVKTTNYSDDLATELAIDGSISLLLTIINIVCIYVAGILVLMIKKVAPISSLSESELERDIKAARDFNKKLNSDSHKDELSEGNNIMKSDRSDFESVLEQAFAWEAFRVAQCDLIDQLKTNNRKHMTWSPAVYTTMTTRPKLQDLYGAYRRISETPSVREAKLNSQLQSYSRLLDDSPKCQASKFTGDETNQKNVKKTKFTITPVSDPTYDTKSNCSLE